MNEQDRLRQLEDYHIMDTLPEEELDELAQIASAICDTPIALVTFIDQERQWFKANIGLPIQETRREDSFCQHALHQPEEVLVVDDPLHDKRFKDNPFVQGEPYIRFYAGAPLSTAQGNVLGTLCILDNKYRNISESQKKALQLLAKKAMDYLETRQQLLSQAQHMELNAARLKKLTDQAPGVIYQMERTPQGELSFPFISQGFSQLYPSLRVEETQKTPEQVFALMHPQDVALVRESLHDSFHHLTRWSVEYRIILEEGRIAWHWTHAQPERLENGTVVWYGSFQDITSKKEYTQTLEQILFDISHIMRRPVATMLGLTKVMEMEDQLTTRKLRQYCHHLKTVSQEMDTYTRKLSAEYAQLKLSKLDQDSE